MSISIARRDSLSGGGSRVSPAVVRAALILIVAGACAAGLVASDTESAAQAMLRAGPDLMRLMRMMAAVKALFVLGLTGGVAWRLAVPVSATRFVAYAACCAVAGASVGLIWHMQCLLPGSAALYGGVLAGGLMLWRDPAVGRRLEAIVAARSARDREGPLADFP